MAALIALVAIRPSCESSSVPPTVADAGTDAAAPVAEPDAGPTAEPQTEPWLVADPQPGAFVALLDGEPVECDFTVGAAGVYPPLRIRAAGITIPQPSAAMSGEIIDTVEIYARSADGQHAFWGEVSVDANALELRAGKSVTVRVVDEDGGPVPSATVRLGREVVGLVMLSASTNESGEATFDVLPDGEFVVTADLASGQAQSSQVAAGGSVTLVAEQGREVLGVVHTPDGAPVAGATVAIHGAGFDTNPLDDVPADILETNLLGEFRTTGVAGAQFVAVVIATGWAPTQSVVLAPEAEGPVRLNVTLRAGHTVRARVVDEGGTPVPHAKVEYKDEESGAGAALLTDGQGRASLVGVPASADVFATLDRFESPRVSLGSLTRKNGYDVELRLTNSDARIWRYRVHVPDGIILKDLEIYDSSGVRCSVSTTDGRDFIARSCGDGTATFHAATDRGTAIWESGEFVDGADVTAPEPTSVKITATGAPNETWESTGFTLISDKMLAFRADVSPQPFGAVGTTRVYPGKWRLSVTNVRVGELPFTFDVGDEPVEMSVELVALKSLTVRVVDAYGAPVTGAYAFLFSEGRLVDASRSAGQLPVEFRVRPPFDGQVLVVDPRRGEGRAKVSTSGDEDVVVKLRESVMSLPVPETRPSREVLAQRLGAKLVERDRGFVLDFTGVSAGTRAGLHRGDFIVSAWPEGARLRVVAYRRGAGYVDVVVP